MYRYKFPEEDPDYRSDRAEFIKAAVYDLLRWDVVADASLTNRLFELDFRNKEIKVREGEPFRRFNAVVDIGCQYIVGGPAWAPEVHSAPRLRLVTNTGPVVYAREESCCPTCKRAVGEN